MQSKVGLFRANPRGFAIVLVHPVTNLAQTLPFEVTPSHGPLSKRLTATSSPRRETIRSSYCYSSLAVMWFEKVQSQSAEVEKLAIEGLKHQLDLASEANRNKKKGPDSQNPADLLQDAGKTSDVCPEDDSSQLKERIIAQLETQLLPQLKQERISWQQAVSILDRLQVDVLQRALQTGVLQPVLAEIRFERASQALQAAADAAQKEQEVAAVGAAQQEQEAAAASHRVARARLAKAKAEAQV